MLGRDAAYLAGNLGRRTDHPREPARVECDAGVPVPGTPYRWSRGEHARATASSAPGTIGLEGSETRQQNIKIIG